MVEKLTNTFDEDREKLLHENFSNREFDVFILLASGNSTSEIARHLSLRPTTISKFRSRIFQKMNMKSNAELVRYELENKLI